MMSASKPVNPQPSREEAQANASPLPEISSTLKASLAKEPPLKEGEGASERSVSAVLYLTGLLVSLCGIFAFNFSLSGETIFSLYSYGLVCIGYAFSYYLRLHRISLRSVQAPLSICLVLALLAVISGNGGAWLMPNGIAENRIIGVQVFITWIIIIHSFLLASDAAVLFAFVPASSMLALVNCNNSDPLVQETYLVLIGAATFLTIHEMTLRTSRSSVMRAKRRFFRRMYGWQMIFALICLGGALLLANIIVIPVRVVGQAFFDPANGTGLSETIKRTGAVITGTEVKEQSAFSLDNGPSTESSLQVMKVEANRGTYWRGATFADYEGHFFTNRRALVSEWRPETNTGARLEESVGKYQSIDSPAFNEGRKFYRMPSTGFDLTTSEMQGGEALHQTFTIMAGNFENLYGAGAIQTVNTTLGTMKYDNTGTIIAKFTSGLAYDVDSFVPTADVNLLRQLTADSEDGEQVSKSIYVPPALREIYTTLPPIEESAQLQEIAAKCIEGKHNDYDRAEAIRAYVASTCKYNLGASAPPKDRDVVSWFLLTSKEGYCTSFAAATVVLCRYAHLPTRMASGFLQGERQSDGSFSVRLKDKHAWAEVFFPKVGWVPFDATDGSTDITDRSSSSKKRTLSFFTWITSHGILPPLLVLSVLGCLGYVFKVEVLDKRRAAQEALERRVKRPVTNTSIIGFYLQAERLLERAGIGRRPSETPNEYLRTLVTRTGSLVPDLGTQFATLTRLHGIYRYGAETETASTTEVEEARSALASLRELIKQLPRTKRPTEPK